MEIDVNKLVYLLLLIGFVYLVYKIIKRLNPSTKANKIRETMPSKSDLRDEAITESYHFAQTLACGFPANAQANARIGVRSASYSSYFSYPHRKSSIITMTVKSELRKEGFSFVSVTNDGSEYTVSASW